MYRDLLPLIVPGFLSARLSFGGLTLGVRSLSGADLALLRSVAKENTPDWTIQIAAASIWMIDGLPLLESHPYSMKVAFDLLRTSHKGVLRGVFAQALSFFSRMRTVNRVFESFLYEEESRRIWRGTNRGVLPLHAQASLPGLERLGSNVFQNSWVAWNRAEDDRYDHDYQWNLTKVLVSVQSSKSAKKLDSKDRARVTGENARRSEVQDKAYYRFVKMISDEEGEARHFVHQPRTVPELTEEMRRWVAGEKDDHDLIVEDYKNRVRDQYESQKRERERAIEEARERRAREEQTLGTQRPGLVGYTKQQLATLRPDLAKPGVRWINEGDGVSKLYNRYLRDTPQTNLEVKNGKVVYRDLSTNPSTAETEGVGETLNDRIARRTPRING